MKKRFVTKQGLSFLLVMWMVLCLAVFAAQAKDAKPKEAKWGSHYPVLDVSRDSESNRSKKFFIWS